MVGRTAHEGEEGERPLLRQVRRDDEAPLRKGSHLVRVVLPAAQEQMRQRVDGHSHMGRAIREDQTQQHAVEKGREVTLVHVEHLARPMEDAEGRECQVQRCAGAQPNRDARGTHHTAQCGSSRVSLPRPAFLGVHDVFPLLRFNGGVPLGQLRRHAVSIVVRIGP